MSWLKQARAKGLGFLRRLIDMMSGIFFRMAYSLTGSSSMPPISNLLLLEPATSLAAKIRSKKVVKQFAILFLLIKVFLGAFSCRASKLSNHS
jgi:hypothetical protein